MAVGASPKLLTELLDLLERKVVLHVGSLAEWVLPGLQPTEVRDVLAGAGLAAPEEVKALFSWHNGVTIGAPSPFPGFGFVPLEEAVTSYQRIQSALSKTAADLGVEPGALSGGAGTGWLRLIPDNYTLAVDCSRPAEQPPYVRATNPDFAEGEAPQIVSLCTLVTWWIEGIDSGAHYWLPEVRRWEIEDSKLPMLQRQIGIV